MSLPRSLLLLAGSSEARALATALTDMGVAVRALLSEPPRGPDPMPVPFDVIAAPDGSALGAAMRGVDGVVDASHGFDAQMTALGVTAARDLDLPFVSLSRPPWTVSEHPKWRSAPTVAAAMPLIAPGARVFSATGWASLPDCAGFPGDVLMLRQTTAHDRPAPFDFVELVFGKPPFSATDEQDLFRRLRIDTVICRNLGGRASRPKLDAAIALDLDVILIDRPPVPPGITTCTSIDGILHWVRAL